jgi:hypothetical protein
MQDSFLDEGFILDKKIGVGQPHHITDAKVLARTRARARTHAHVLLHLHCVTRQAASPPPPPPPPHTHTQAQPLLLCCEEHSSGGRLHDWSTLLTVIV